MTHCNDVIINVEIHKTKMKFKLEKFRCLKNLMVGVFNTATLMMMKRANCLITCGMKREGEFVWYLFAFHSTAGGCIDNISTTRFRFKLEFKLQST